MDSIWRTYWMISHWPNAAYDLRSEIQDELHDQISLGIKDMILAGLTDETT